MKRALAALALAALAATIVYGFSVTRRERLYRQLIVQGDAALSRGDGFAAVDAFGQAITLKPESMLGFLKRGYAHHRRGDLDGAAADLARAAALDPSSPRVLELFGDVEVARHLYGQAAARYAASLQLDDRAPRVLYKLALATHLDGRSGEAVPPLQRAVALDGRLAEAHYLLGICLRELGRVRDAERALRQAIRIAPGMVAAREQLADLYREAGRPAEQVAQLERIAAADPAPARQIALAHALAGAGDANRAVRLLRKVADLHPDHAATYLALGRIWLETAVGEDTVALAKAIEALEHATALDPSPAAYTELGRAHLAGRDPAAALRVLQDATRRLPLDPPALLLLAEAAEHTGEPTAAREALAEYVALAAPGDSRRTAASERLDRLLSRAPAGAPGRPAPSRLR